MDKIALVGDFGGTNARLALSTPEGLRGVQEYKCADFDSPQSIVKTYQDSANAPAPEHAVFAVAGPSDDPTQIIFTNGPWKQKPVNFATSVKNTEILNDFAAVCYSIALLKPNDCSILVDGHAPFFPSLIMEKNDFSAHPSRILEADPSQRFVAIGPGTGLGVGTGLVTKNCQFLVLGGEGGHASLTPATEDELAVKTYLEENNILATMETMASGSGLILTFNAIAKVRGIDISVESAAEIPRLMHCQKKDVRGIAKWTLEAFAKTLGSCASSAALTNNAQTVFIAGGVVQKLGSYFDQTAFTQAYRNNDLYKNNILIDVPVMLIAHPQPGLLGAHAYFQLSR